MIQYLRLTALTYRIPLACLIALAGFTLPIPHVSAASASEQSNLAIMIRQLNALENTTQRSAQLSDEPGKRYYFDYPRLTRDVERIRMGLGNYLTPSRAQPRDPAELSGSYSTEGRKP